MSDLDPSFDVLELYDYIPDIGATPLYVYVGHRLFGMLSVRKMARRLGLATKTVLSAQKVLCSLGLLSKPRRTDRFYKLVEKVPVRKPTFTWSDEDIICPYLRSLREKAK